LHDKTADGISEIVDTISGKELADLVKDVISQPPEIIEPTDKSLGNQALCHSQTMIGGSPSAARA
jgi:hypothetical protein